MEIIIMFWPLFGKSFANLLSILEIIFNLENIFSKL